MITQVTDSTNWGKKIQDSKLKQDSLKPELQVRGGYALATRPEVPRAVKSHSAQVPAVLEGEGSEKSAQEDHGHEPALHSLRD